MQEEKEQKGVEKHKPDKTLMAPIRIRTDDGEFDKSFSDYVMELDKERIYVKTSDPLAVGTKIHLACDLPGAPKVIHLKGEVVRINTSPSSGINGLEAGMGVIFERVGFDDRSIIRDYIENVASEEHKEEYETFISWIQKISQPMTNAEKERIKKDFLKAIYGGGKPQRAVSPEARRKSREDLEIMSKIPLFKKFDDVELDEIARIAIKEKYSAGQMVFNEGERGDKFYIILNGSVDVMKKISKDEYQTLVTLKEGDYFGEMALIDNAPRSAGISVKEDLTVLSISRSDLRILLNASSSISAKIYEFFITTLVKRLRDTNEKIKQFIMMTGPGQL